MKLSLITRRNKKLFDSKINKKSQFLRSLPKKKFEGQKKVDEGKTELIIHTIEIYSRIKRAKKRPRSPNPKSKSKNINSWFKKCKTLK